MKLIGMVISPLHCATPFCFQDKNEPPKPPSRVRNEVLVGKTAGKPGFQSIIDNIEKNSFPSWRHFLIVRFQYFPILFLLSRKLS